jgi:2,4-dienoyl-CoA reductase-like NADH-dependent reductase (Old Yellow Enzyme family)
MKRIFEKTEIKGLNLANRLIRSATWEARADEQGRVGEGLSEMLTDLARGGVGLIVAGFAYVSEGGQAMPFQTGLHSEEMLPGLQRLTESVHQAGGVVAAQIVHGGVMALQGPIGPSVVEVPGCDHLPRELSLSGIQSLVEDFARAAARARAAGFDAVQLHGAHGYLLSQFLSPFFNRRGDRYGGSALNRARMIYETYEAVRGEVGSDYPVMIKINSEDGMDGGLNLEDSLRVAVNLASMGLDAVEVSGGLPFLVRHSPVRLRIDTPEKEGYFRKAAAAFKEKVRIPVILVGGLRSPEIMTRVLEQGQADYLALARPFIREPHLAERWRSGDLEPAACLSCNRCFNSGLKGDGVSCTPKVLGRSRKTNAD